MSATTVTKRAAVIAGIAFMVATANAQTVLFSDTFDTPIRPALHGDSSGVRGAAWLWPPE